MADRVGQQMGDCRYVASVQGSCRTAGPLCKKASNGSVFDLVPTEQP
jgi:hypothetical protein